MAETPDNVWLLLLHEPGGLSMLVAMKTVPVRWSMTTRATESGVTIRLPTSARKRGMLMRSGLSRTTLRMSRSAATGRP